MSLKNLFISNSSRKYKYYFLSFFVGFYFLYGLSFIVLILKPEIFYWRAWEYFDDIGFRVPNKEKWIGYEFGEDSRPYLYSYGSKWKTKVSTDHEGYRSVPYGGDFSILVVGDSNIWGSHLSDEETIPWNLATQLGLSVFNGGRDHQKLPKLIGNPRLKKVKLIVEILGEHHLSKDMIDRNDFTYDKFETYAIEKKYNNYFKIHPKRFFLPLKVTRKCNLKKPLINEFRRKKLFDEYAVPIKIKYSTLLKEEDFQQMIQNIAKRASILQSMGYKYMIAIIPKKTLLLGKYIYEKEIDQQKRIAEELRARNVHYVDIYKVFREFENPHALYIQTDSHVNVNGAKLIAKTISDHISDQSLSH